MIKVLKVTVKPEENDTRLDRWVRRRFAGLGQAQIEKALRKGVLRVDGKKVKSNFRLQSGMEVQMPEFTINAPNKSPAAKISDKDRSLIKSMVIYDDGKILALNKPSGLATQGGTNTNRHIDGMLAAFDDGEYSPKLVHRLDKDTSGLLLLGRTPNAAAALAKSFKSRSAKKTYLAIVLGTPRPHEGVIKGYMKKGTGQMGREIMVWGRHGERNAQYSRSLYRVISRAGEKASLVALRPETGRTHQLRFHLAEIGYAISGDRKYVCDREDVGGIPEQLMLHSWRISLPHPDKGQFELSCPIPEHFAEAMDMLGFDLPSTMDPFEDIQ